MIWINLQVEHRVNGTVSCILQSSSRKNLDFIRRPAMEPRQQRHRSNLKPTLDLHQVPGPKRFLVRGRLFVSNQLSP